MIVTIDTEIGKVLQDCGGWEGAKAGYGGMACAVTVTDFATDSLYGGYEGQVHLWDEHNVDELVGVLQAAGLVVSFNGATFDLSVIQGVAGSQLFLARHYDILAEIWKAVGRMEKGWTLDDVSKRTIGRGKTGYGAHAPELVRLGRWAELFQYCLEDVRLTRDLLRCILQETPLIRPDGTDLHLPAPFIEDTVS